MLTYKIISVAGAMAMGAAVVLVMPGFSPEADASTPPKVVDSKPLDVRLIGKDCTEQAWPYYEAGCLRDHNRANGQAGAVADCDHRPRPKVGDQAALRLPRVPA